MTAGPSFTRWYDKDPRISKTFRLMERLREEYISIVCHWVLKTSDELDTRGHQDKGLKNVGSEKIVGLMKSKIKRRWYDQSVVVHQAVNAIYLMEDSARLVTALRILLALKALRDFLEEAQTTGRVWQDEELLTVVGDVFLQTPKAIIQASASLDVEETAVELMDFEPMFRGSCENTQPDSSFNPSGGSMPWQGDLIFDTQSGMQVKTSFPKE